MNGSEPIVPRSVDPEHPRWIETLRDRTRVVIREVTARDASAEREFLAATSPQSRSLRFLGEVRRPGEELIARMTTPDLQQTVAFAATVPEDAHDKFLGIARYSVSADGQSCECAVAVLDAWHHRGLGTVLMRHLIDFARARGITYMHANDSIDNLEMADLARFLGFERHPAGDHIGRVVHSLRLSPPKT
jgi:GNAT superfamily N-acetyltransferase